MRSIVVSLLLLGHGSVAIKHFRQDGWFQGIRLVDGGRPLEGRVEVNWNGEWGTVCDDDWDINAGHVVCKMLGYTAATLATHSAYFGMGNGKILLDNVFCQGTEGNITDCRLKSDAPWGDSDCQHHEDAGVVCKNERIVGFDVMLKGKKYSDIAEGGRLMTRLKPLRAGRRKHKIPYIEGFLETKTSADDANWRKICLQKDDVWTWENAFVACGQLGFPGVARWEQEDYMGDIMREHIYMKKKKPHLKRVFGFGVSGMNCTGRENEVSWCEHQRKQKCLTNQPIVIKCQSLPSFEKFKSIHHAYREHISRHKGYGRRSRGKVGSMVTNLGIAGLSAGVGDGMRNMHAKGHKQQNVRLRGGDKLASGRVEIVRRGRWGSICDTNWTMEAANVVCREMGFGSAYQSNTRSTYGPGHSPIWMANVACAGTENSIYDCPHSNVSTPHAMPEDKATDKYDCTHDREVGVICHTPDFAMDKKIRVVGGRSKLEGRVEIKAGGKWGAVCSDHWTILEATVVCRQLGLGYAQNALFDAYFYKATPGLENTISMTDVACTGSELGLHDCPMSYKKKALNKCRKNTYGNWSVAGIMCQPRAPDLITDVPLLVNTLHIELVPMYRLECANEEGCLGPTVKNLRYQNGNDVRKLLRFSTRTWNRGTSAFLPAMRNDQWEWHACHRHFHSMQHFIDYDILGLNGTKMAQGYKASFCLEDVDCYGEGRRNYRCNNRRETPQGISVGCADTYRYNLDCQWIDISDLPDGNYLIRLNTNPQHFVAESDFMNNDIICNLDYKANIVSAKNCHIPDDYVAGHLDKYYTEQVYADWLDKETTAT